MFTFHFGGLRLRGRKEAQRLLLIQILLFFNYILKFMLLNVGILNFKAIWSILLILKDSQLILRMNLLEMRENNQKIKK